MRTIPEFFYDAISSPGMTTQMVRSILMFLIMVVGLVLPMGRFFIARKANEPVHLPSRRLAVSLLIGLNCKTVQDKFFEVIHVCWVSLRHFLDAD